MDEVDGKGQKPQWGTACGSSGIWHTPDSCPAAGRHCHISARKWTIFQGCFVSQMGKRSRYTFYYCDSDSEVLAVNAEDRDWVEAVNFWSIQEVFKLHMEAQCNVLLAVAAPQLWNSLPYAIRSSPSLASFKKTLKTFLFQKAFLWFYVLFNLVFSLGFMQFFTIIFK